MKRTSFLVYSGAALATGTANANPYRSINVIVLGRFGTGYHANIPAWTPKAALSHPLTAELNRIARFTPEARRLTPNIDRAMASRTRVFDPNLCIAGAPNCGHPTPAPTPKPLFTGASKVVPPSSYYAGNKYLGSAKAPPAVDAYGAQSSGYATSSTQYAIHNYGQNPTLVNKSSLGSYATGTFQYGTTTFTHHATLPMLRWHDPVYGSGVAYYDHPTSSINVAMSSDPATLHPTQKVFRQAVQYPSATVDPQWIGFDLGLVGIGIATGLAGIAIIGATIAATPVVIVAAAFGAIILGLAGVIFGLIRLLMGSAAPAVGQPSGNATQVSGGDGPPDGLDSDGDLAGGGYGDGGGGNGSDQVLMA